MENTLFRLTNSETPGYAMAVVKDGKMVLMETVGMADLDRKIPITAKTAFRLASLSKQFTAMALMILAERKKLDLENKIADYFSDYPAYGNEVTVRQLLTHTAGIPDHEKPLYKLINQEKNFNSEPTIYDALEVLKSQPTPLFSPGSRYQYSDAGFVLLALIIEKISGLSYREFLQQNIFSPLGMDNSDVSDQSKPLIKNRALGYKINSSLTGLPRPAKGGARNDRKRYVFKCKFEIFEYDPLNYIIGDEGVYSSIEDMVKWSRAWDEEDLISRKSLAETMAPARLTNGKYGKAGLSWLIGKYHGEKIIYQDGSWVGFRNIILKIPEQKLTVIILSNRNDLDTEGMRISLAYQLAREFL